MLKKILGTILALSAAAVCAAQSTPAKSIVAKQYRLTILLSNPQNEGLSQRFVFDVDVAPDQPGQAEMHLSSGPTGDIGPKQTLKCLDVHASQAGLAAKVSYTMDSVSPEPMPGSTEHLITHQVFEKQVDLPLASPTEITEIKALKPLNENQPARPAPLHITVTAIRL